MKRPPSIFLFFRLPILFLFFFIIYPNASPCQIPEKVKGIGKYGRKVYSITTNYISTYKECVANGYGAPECQKAAALCSSFDFTTNNLPGLPAEIYRALGLFESFKPYCGNGICYQCCFDGDNCHTSFIGFPVINCNYNYGPETRPAGLTMVLNGDPGDPCLFTPQTCNHLALCLTGLSPAQIDDINNDPDHIMKTQDAKDQRARHYAEDLMETRWSNFLNGFTAGDPLVTDSAIVLYEETKMVDLFDFMTGRGHPHWREFLDSMVYFDFNSPGFAVLDSNGQFLEGPSRWNFTKQLGLAQTLAAAPNLRNRLDYTGSYIWTPASLATYLSSVGDADSTLLSQMYPLAFYFFTENPRMQDYRLLAVPLLGETVLPDYFNGDTLGQPPVHQVVKSYLDSNRLQLDLSILSPGTHNPNYPFSGQIYWGDGTNTFFELSDFMADTSLVHTYRDTGKYQAFTIVENSSGLRSVKFDEANIQSNLSFDITETPAIHTAWLYDVTVSTTLFTFTDEIGFNITTGLDTNRILLGKEAMQFYGNNTTISLDTVMAHNPDLFQMDSLVIEPIFIDDDVDGTTRFRFKFLKAMVYDPANDMDTVFSLPLVLDSIRLYDSYGNLRPETYLKTQDASGLITVFIEYDTINLGKIVIPIDQDSLRNYYIPPVNSGLWTGSDDLYIETRPDVFELVADPYCGYNVMNITYDPIPSGTYNSGGSIYSAGRVASGDTVAFKAEEAITMLSSFYAELGSDFLAVIQPCVNPPAAPSILFSPPHSNTPTTIQPEKPVVENFQSASKVVKEKAIFKFQISEQATPVSIRLTHIASQSTTDLLDRVLYEPGHHQFLLEREGLPSGVYQVVFMLDNEIKKIDKLVLL